MPNLSAPGLRIVSRLFDPLGFCAPARIYDRLAALDHADRTRCDSALDPRDSARPFGSGHFRLPALGWSCNGRCRDFLGAHRAALVADLKPVATLEELSDLAAPARLVSHPRRPCAAASWPSVRSRS